MVNFRYFIILLSILWADFSTAQNRYMVFFNDKAGSPFNINQPEGFLSVRSIARYNRQGINFKEKDLPVNPDYIAGVKNLGALYYYQTRWLNGILIEADPAIIPTIEGLQYVKSVELVAVGPRLKNNGKSMTSQQSTNQNESPVVLNASQNDFLGITTLNQLGYDGSGILIGVFDSGFKGVNTSGAFDKIIAGNQLLQVHNFVENDKNIYQYEDHGTRVLSTMAAFITDKYTGSSLGSNYLLYVTEDKQTEYRIEEYNFLFAAEKADSAGVDIINLSLGYNTGFNDPSMDYNYSQMDGQTAVITLAAEMAIDRGILVICGAGNEGGNNVWPYIIAPADGPRVLAVGAVNTLKERAFFSSIGPNAAGITKPDVMAIGASALVVNQNGAVGSYAGTSFAAPQITGLAALLWQRQPTLTNLSLLDLIKSMGDRAQAPDNYYGFGIPHYGRIVTGLDADVFKANIYPNPTNEVISIETSKPMKSVCLFSIHGQIMINQEFMNQTKIKLNMEELSSGFYILHIISRDGKTDKRKIQKY